MRHFAKLFLALDQTTQTNLKVEAMVHYLQQVNDEDKLWMITILSNRHRFKRSIKTSDLQAWFMSLEEIPVWLFEESYQMVGDVVETIALVLPKAKTQSKRSLTEWIHFVRQLHDVTEAEKWDGIHTSWQGLSSIERLVFNKFITGSFRITIPQKLLVRALAQFTQVDENIVAHRLTGNWHPDEDSFEALMFSDHPQDNHAQPYPFQLANNLELEVSTLGQPEAWQAERIWDGIRGQIILRGGEIFLWSEAEELITNKFPEYHILKEILPEGTVLDGEILPFKAGKPLALNVLQTRIGRKNVTKKLIKDMPVVFMAFDLLEWEGVDISTHPLEYRQQLLEALIAKTAQNSVLMLSDVLTFQSWEALDLERKKARQYFSKGILLKRKDAPYLNLPEHNDWWQWKVDPLVIDTVMIYAQKGPGHGTNAYTHYTFAVWDGDQLIPFTKASSGLTETEIQAIDAFVKKNTVERFGPVRSINPELVFEIAFEDIQASKRHKSGVTLRAPHIKHWHKDKHKAAANTLVDLHQMLKEYGA